MAGTTRQPFGEAAPTDGRQVAGDGQAQVTGRPRRLAGATGRNVPADRFSTATRLRALGTQAAERVYRARGRRVRAPHGRLTGRAALLALVVCSLVVALAYPMRQYVSQRTEIAEQQRQAAHARERVHRLREERARWHDPAYAEQRARAQLHFVRTGETGYTMRDGSADERRPADHRPADRPWYENLWSGLDSADDRH